MKVLLLSLIFVILTACSQQAVYNMLHERERQECLKQGRSDCPKTESDKEYKQQREESVLLEK